MKTIKFLLILVVAFIFMGNVNAQTNLAAWHFDVLAVAPNTPKIIKLIMDFNQTVLLFI